MSVQPSGPPKRQALRRYPALAFLAIAAVLAVALPSALTLPNAGPPTLAEFAPVPGQGQDAGGDLGRLGSGSSGDVGFGSGNANTPGQPPLDPGQPGGKRKQCVGNPPRQTEDPLSPPCVAFFKGDNLGATTRGVTGDEIKIVIDLSAVPGYALVDYDKPEQTFGRQEGDAFTTTARAFQSYFNARYQTYGRRVHFYGMFAGNGLQEIRAGIQKVREDLGPFALLSARATDSLAVTREAARAGILGVSYAAFDRRVQQRNAPRLISFAPDLQDEANIAAGFVCDKLAGRPARFSDNPGDAQRERTFGIVVRDDGTTPERPLLAELLVAELERRCGIDPVMQSAGSATQDTAGHGLNMAAFRNQNITTVIAIGTSENHLLWANAGQDLGYLPEWVIPGSAEMSGADLNESARQFPPAFWANAFGISYDRRRPARTAQHWFQAFKEGCPDCTDTGDTSNRPSRVYDELTLLFWGIQAAGPRLTEENLDKGLHAIPQRPSKSPDLPAAYFAAANYSWVKDAAAIWWDGSEQEPGSNNPGCYRLARLGHRFRAREWKTGDGDLFSGSMPCQGPSR